MYMWSRKYSECVQCKTNKVPHKAKGLCCSCYDRKVNDKYKTTIILKTRNHHEFILTKSFLEKELIDATNKIWGTLGNSFVIYEGDKILIVDKLPKEQAKNVILMNNGGIGFSNTGINGTFVTAWTIDGGFNANFITSGKIDTSLIEGYDNFDESIRKTITKKNIGKVECVD